MNIPAPDVTEAAFHPQLPHLDGPDRCQLRRLLDCIHLPLATPLSRPQVAPTLERDSVPLPVVTLPKRTQLVAHLDYAPLTSTILTGNHTGEPQPWVMLVSLSFSLQAAKTTRHMQSAKVPSYTRPIIHQD